MLHISLTSIPPRFAGLAPLTKSLMSQENVAGVHITLPRSYTRFPGPVTPPLLPAGIQLHWCDQDLGPAIKILPLAKMRPDDQVLYCDDDWNYADGWATAFTRAARDHPDRAIAASTYSTTRLGVGKGTIAQGFGGVLIRSSMLPPEAWQIPSAFHPVDDIWLSGMLALAGVTIQPLPSARSLATPSGNEAAPLQTATDRAGLNRSCARWLRDRYGLWPSSAG